MIIRALPALLVLTCLSCYAQGPAAPPAAPAAAASSSAEQNQTTPSGPPQVVTTRPSRGNLRLPDWVTHSRNYPASAAQWASVINPGQRVSTLTFGRKFYYAGREQLAPIVFIPALVSSGYGHLADTDPHYGSDSAGFGERFGASMLSQATDRLSGDGLFSALFRQDPRYYRVGEGSIKHRVLGSVVQAVVRRGDNGNKQFNWSGMAGHALSNGLTLTYYPDVSATGGVVAGGIGVSIAGDVAGKLIEEFLPDAYRLTFQRKH